MKFKIRFADQIVGFFIILSLVFLVFLVLMLGRTQRWFAKDISFTTTLPSANGLSKNMAVQFRGFTIGSVTDFYLAENDDVEIIFVIHEEYGDRVRLGSMVEIMVSPIGLGNQFLFHPGIGEEILEEGSYIPVVGSDLAKDYVSLGLAVEPRNDDSITALVGRVSAILEDVNQISTQVAEALGEGSDITEVGKIVGSLQRTLTGVEDLPDALALLIEEIQDDLQSILSNISGITSTLDDPDSLISKVLDGDGEVYGNLLSSLVSLSSTLDGLDRTVTFIPGQLPQLAGIIVDLRTTLQLAEDVLTALTNNPILRGGVPERPNSPPGISPRDLRF